MSEAKLKHYQMLVLSQTVTNITFYKNSKISSGENDFLKRSYSTNRVGQCICPERIAFIVYLGTLELSYQLKLCMVIPVTV